MNTKLIYIVLIIATVSGILIYLNSKKQIKKTEDKKINETKKSTNTLPTPDDNKKSTFNIKVPDSKLLNLLTKKDIISFINKSQIDRIAKETAIPVKKILTPEDVQQAKETIKYIRAFNRLGKIDISSYYDMIVDLPLAIWVYSEPAFNTKSMHYLQIDEIDTFMRLEKVQIIGYDDYKKFNSYLQDWYLENTANLGLNRPAFKPSNSLRYPYPEGIYKWCFDKKPFKPANRVHPSYAKFVAASYIDTFQKPVFKPSYFDIVDEDADTHLVLNGYDHLYYKNIRPSTTTITIQHSFWESTIGEIVLFAGTFALNFFASQVAAIAQEYADSMVKQIQEETLHEITKTIVDKGIGIAVNQMKDAVANYASGYGVILTKNVAVSGLESLNSNLLIDLYTNHSDDVNKKISYFSNKLVNSKSEEDFNYYNRTLLEFPTWESEK